MAQKLPEPFIDSGLPEAASSRTQIGISIESPINRRLVEGVSAQLGLVPIFLEEADLAHPQRIVGVELLVADEPKTPPMHQVGDRVIPERSENEWKITSSRSEGRFVNLELPGTFKASLIKGWIPVIVFLIISSIIGMILGWAIMTTVVWLTRQYRCIGAVGSLGGIVSLDALPFGSA